MPQLIINQMMEESGEIPLPWDNSSQDHNSKIKLLDNTENDTMTRTTVAKNGYFDSNNIYKDQLTVSNLNKDRP